MRRVTCGHSHLKPAIAAMLLAATAEAGSPLELGHLDLGHGVTLTAALLNLADRSYIEWTDVRGRPEGDPLIPYYTRPGRNAALTLRWEY